jgi:hypothetical protein
MAGNICAADNRRHLSIFSFKSDFGIFNRPTIRTQDVSLDGGTLR